MAKLQKQSVRFTQVANSVLCDKNISAKAKWIYAYLYSKPDNWQFAYNRIASEFSDWEKSILSGLKELEKFWYLERKKQGDGSTDYVLYIEPTVENRHLDTDPTAEKGKLPFRQVAEIGTINNTDINTNTEIYSNTKSGTKKIEKNNNSITIEDLSFIPNKNIKDGVIEFFHYRKAMKKPIKKESLPAFFRQLQKLSDGNEKIALEILEQSIANGWQWIFPIKNHKFSKNLVWQA